METTLRTRFAHCFALNALYGFLIVVALVAINATQAVEQQATPSGVTECWNPHTAQITVVDAGTCPTPENPYR